MHELKAGLSRYVAQARAGEVIEITSHDKPVARLVGVPQAQLRGLDRLLTTGAVQWAGGKPALVGAVKLAEHGRFLSDLVLEDRR